MNWDIIISSETEVACVDEKIVNFNKNKLAFTQDPVFMPLNFHIKDDKGAIIAGINAIMYGWKMLHIDVIAIDQEYRGQKMGTLLLKKVENDAKMMGASLVHLDTFDFQAKDFYLKQGYEIFGVLDNCPTGHKRYYMKKHLI